MTLESKEEGSLKAKRSLLVRVRAEGTLVTSAKQPNLLVTDSRGCEHEGTKVETASNRLNGVADPEGATPHLHPKILLSQIKISPLFHGALYRCSLLSSIINIQQ